MGAVQAGDLHATNEKGQPVGCPFALPLIALVSDGAGCTQTGLRADELGEEALTLLLPAWTCR